MKRKFLVNILFLLTVSIVVKGVWVLGIDRTVQNVVGEAAYGGYFSLFSFSILFTMLLDMGLSGFSKRSVSADPATLRLYFGNILLLRLMLVAAYGAVTLGGALLAGYDRQQLSLLLLLMLNQVMASMIIWLRSNISGMQLLFTDTLFSVADRLIMIIICSMLLLRAGPASPFRIGWFVLAQTVAYFIVMSAAFLFVVIRGGVSMVRYDRGLLREVTLTGLPYAAVALSMTLYWRIDSVLIERMMSDGAASAGAYAQPFRLFDAIAMIPVMFGGMLLPLMTRGLSSGKDIAPLTRMAGRLLLVPLGIGAVTLASWPSGLLEMLYRAPAAGAAEAFPLLMAALIPTGVTYIGSTILTAAGKLKILAAITMTGLLLNLLLNVTLIPAIGISGAAVSALATQTAVAAACTAAARMTMFRIAAPKRMAAYLALLGLTLLTGWLLQQTRLSWQGAAALQLVTGMALALAFRFMPANFISLTFTIFVQIFHRDDNQ